jgi:biotin carboxyl carrier protein
MLVGAGDHIEIGQTIAVLESMKMEIDVVSPVAGTVHAVNRGEGSPVNAGQALIVIREQIF